MLLAQPVDKLYRTHQPCVATVRHSFECPPYTTWRWLLVGLFWLLTFRRTASTSPFILFCAVFCCQAQLLRVLVRLEVATTVLVEIVLVFFVRVTTPTEYKPVGSTVCGADSTTTEFDTRHFIAPSEILVCDNFVNRNHCVYLL